MVNKFTKIKDRVVEIAEKQPISKEAFFKSIGMTSANFRGKAKETPLNSNAIVNIITKYPKVNLYWLLLGDDNTVDLKDNLVEEPNLSKYKVACKKCNEKGKMITTLEKEIEELKTDKEDLKVLLGLRRK